MAKQIFMLPSESDLINKNKEIIKIRNKQLINYWKMQHFTHNFA